MLAKMAAEDIRDLELRGVKLTPAQIVRLNDLALRATRGAEAAAFVHAPRVAWADADTPLFEPSIAAEIWLRDFAGLWWCGQSLVIATAWAAAHGRDGGEQWNARHSETAVRREIESWQRGLTCTMPQLLVALNYALNGIPRESAAAAPAAEAEPDGCPYTDMLAEAVSAGLGVPVAELERMSTRTVSEYVRRWTRNQIALAGGKPGAVNARAGLRDWCAYDDYLNTLDPEGVKNG